MMTTENLMRVHGYDCNTCHPAVYVGTYHKYDCGSIYGAWLDLTSFADYEDFKEACRSLHDDENDPEFMLQDYMNFPRDFYSESMLSEKDFDSILEYAELCDKYGCEAIDAFVSISDTPDLGRFENTYLGEWDSMEDFAEHILDECYPDIPEFARRYFDISAFARELFFDYCFENGFVFDFNR